MAGNAFKTKNPVKLRNEKTDGFAYCINFVLNFRSLLTTM